MTGSWRGAILASVADEVSKQKSCITPEGLKRLQEEIRRLWKVERPRVAREVSDAAAQGDRSENAEYIYGKRRLREIDARIRFLRKRFDALQVVRPGETGRDRVYFGAWVTLEAPEGDHLRYRLVGPDETDVALGHISAESPLGRALIGRELGDEVTVVRPAGSISYTLLDLSYAS